MLRRPFRFAILALCCCALPALALSPGRTLTQYVHRIWQAQQGLPDGAINRILQDPDGYLWLSTEVGFFRFDGVNFTQADSLIRGAPADRYIRAAELDRSGTFWLGGDDGVIYALSRKGTTQYGREQGMPQAVVQCLLADRDGDIWACTERGLIHISPANRTSPVHVLHPSDGLHTETLRSVCQAPNGDIWIGGDTPNLSIYSQGKITTIPLAGIPEAASVRGLLCDRDGVWAGTTFGLIRIQDGRQRLFTTADGLVDNFVFAVERGASGALWVGTRSGFSRLHNGVWHSFHPHDGLSQSSAQAMLEDSEGSLWVGTKRGLDQFVDGRTVPYTTSEGLPSNDTGPVLQDSAGTVWAGTLNAGLAYFDGTFKTLTTADGLPSNTVRVLMEDRGHALWAGTASGLIRIERAEGGSPRITRRLGVADGLPSADIRSLFLDRGGVLRIGTAAGLAAYDRGRVTTDRRAPRVAVRCIAQDRDGNLVIGLDEGIFLSTGGAFFALEQGDIYMRNPNAFVLDRDGYLWAALNGAGLRMIDGRKISEWITWDGLYDSELVGLTLDDQDRLWMACTRGIFWVARGQLLQFARGEVSRVHSVAYSPTESLRVVEGRQGVQPSLSRAGDGTLWLSTARGLLALHPDLSGGAPPDVKIEDPIVNGQPMDAAAMAQLSGGQKNVQFIFARRSYLQPEEIRYRYWLEGQDEGWIDAGTRREVSYTNLPPGDYLFHVNACTVDGTCNETGASLAFTLEPLFYQRLWFWPMVLLALGGIALLAYRLHIRQLHARYELILSERSRIARELHDTLIQGFSGITMALQALSARVRTPSEKETLHDIIQDAATCLRETRQSVAGLRSTAGPQSGIARAVREAVRELTETKPIRVKLNIEETRAELPAEAEYNLLRIVREAVSNSVKHSGAGEIEVKLRATPEALNITVRDDGSGFDREDAFAPGPGHYGIIGMKERATQIGATIEVRTHPGEGTLISLNLPLAATAGHPVEVSR